MERTDRGYRLSSGREFKANAGLISVARYANGTFRIREGYEGTLPGATGDECDASDPRERELNWTADERRELANFMIAQWTAFKDSLKE